MSSSQPFQGSSPLSANQDGRRKSRFTYKQLSQLALSSTSCPLRVIAHIDLDAFYAQCEMVRLGVAEDQPLAVQQWQGLIAINYPARKFGLGRHITISEAKKLCPNLIVQHVATWREGDEKWAYHDDAFENIATHKVSLDPYRLESRRILACIREALPADLQRVEKASVDEVFLELSSQIHATLLERYPELAQPAPYDDPTECLPRPPTTVLDWQADALIDLDADQTEEDDPDWDDICLRIGSEIVQNVRTAIREKLKYTCSAGISGNKMLAKLGSAHRKPNSQTVIRHRAIQHFLSDFNFTKIRGLGGKLGEQITSTFNTSTVQDLLLVSFEQLKQKMGDTTGTWIYQIIRGNDSSDVNSRTQIKSMLSAKSFRPSINTLDQAHRWLRIFVADIYSRLVEEGVLENKRRPRTMILHHRHGAQTSSRGQPISMGKRIDEVGLFQLAKTLLGQIILEGRVWPCANLSLSVSGFEEAVSGNQPIGAFLLKGEDARALGFSSREMTNGAERPDKRRRLDPAGIQRFFQKHDSIDDLDDDFESKSPSKTEKTSPTFTEEDVHKDTYTDTESVQLPKQLPSFSGPPNLDQLSSTKHMCSRCSLALQSDSEVQSHQDWHFAKDLQDEERAQPPQALGGLSRNPHTKIKSNKKKTGPSRPEKGQTKLFGGGDCKK